MGQLGKAFNENIKLSQLLAFDFWGGLVAGVLVYAWAFNADNFAVLGTLDSLLIGVVGVIIGASVTALALLTAFFDARLLNDLAAIGRPPTRYLVPFLATICIGLVAELLLILALLSLDVSDLGGVLLSGAAVFFSVWCILSIILSLDALLQFLQLKQISAEE